MLWPLSFVLVVNTNGRLAIPALAGLLVVLADLCLGGPLSWDIPSPFPTPRRLRRLGLVAYGDSTSRLRRSIVDPPEVVISPPMLGGLDKTLNARGLRDLGGPKPDPNFLYILIFQVL